MKIKVRIAVAANAHGSWQAVGFPNCASWDEAMDSFEVLDNEQRFWIEAELEVAAEPPVVICSVMEANP